VTEGVMLFGKSKAGKSTLISRLLAKNTTCEDFCKSLHRTGAREEYGVYVDSSMIAATIVPRCYHVGQLDIYDMPGLNDPDNVKKIVISALHKCLINRVRKTRFLIVIGLGDFVSEGMQTVINLYITQLLSLFGAMYNEWITSCTFLLTQADKYPNAEPTILIQQFLRQSRKLNTAGAVSFFNAMLANHVVLDYSRMGYEDILSILQDNVSETCSDIIMQDLNLKDFDQGDLTLVRLCQLKVNRVLDDVEVQMKSNKIKMTTMKNTITMADDSIRRLQSSLKNMRAELAQKIDQEKKLSEQKRVWEDECESLKQSVAQLQQKLDIEVAANSSLMLAIQSTDCLSFTLFDSRVRSVNPWKKDEVIKFNIHIKNPDELGIEFLAFRSSDSDFFSKIDEMIYNQESNVTLADFRGLNESSILYNSIDKLSTESFNIDFDIDRGKSALSLNAENSTPFKLLVIFKQAIGRTSEYKSLRASMSEKLRNISNDLKSKSDKLNDLIKYIQDAQEILPKYTTQIAHLTVEVDNRQGELAAMESNRQVCYSNMNNILTTSVDLVDLKTHKDELTLVRDTLGILRGNELKFSVSTVEDLITKQRERLTPMLNEMRTLETTQTASTDVSKIIPRKAVNDNVNVQSRSKVGGK
jgi:GTP-binding protein EngB required for normal cell division